MIKALVLSSLFIFTSFARAEGGHVGNGGGVVECLGKAPVVLDYYEAQQKGENLLDLEKMTRADFFKLMIARLKEGSAKQEPGFFAGFHQSNVNDVYSFNFGTNLEKSYQVQPAFDQWTETTPFELKDEFVEESLPEGCHFAQAAISLFDSVQDHLYRIRSVTDRLSRGQILLLELHEYLNQVDRETGSSTSLRELVQVLIQKRVSYPELRVAVYRFSDPSQDYYWKNGLLYSKNSYFDNPKNFDDERFHSNPALYGLDLRNISAQERSALRTCPQWLSLIPLSGGNSELRLTDDKSGEMKDFRLPLTQSVMGKKKIISHWKNKHYLREVVAVGESNGSIDLDLFENNDHFIKMQRNQVTCNYVKIDGDFSLLQSWYKTFEEMRNSMRTELFPRSSRMSGPGFEAYVYLKRVQDYYQKMHLGIKSEFEDQMQSYRDYLQW